MMANASHWRDEEGEEFHRQALDVALAVLLHVARELGHTQAEGRLTMADRERLLKMCDMAHRMGRRALGVGGTSD